MRILAFTLWAAGVVATASGARAADEVPAPNPEGSALASAITLLDAGRREEAAAELATLVEQGVPGARYYFGKALYRLGFLHGALEEFEAVLAEGPEGRFHRASLEWCLFIGRKLVDDHAVNEVLIAHGDGRFPERYRDEFLFRLARHHYTRALVERGAKAVAQPPPAPEKPEISFEDDLFGEAEAAPPPKVKKRKKRGRKRVKKRKRRGRTAKAKRRRRGRRRAAPPAEAPRDGGISFGEDLFGEAPDPSAPAPAEKKAPKPTLQAPSEPDHRESARRMVARVSPTSPFFPRSKFIEALLLVQAKRENEALGAFKAVVEATKAVPDNEDDQARSRRQRLRELAFFQLARLHFGAKQPSFSIFYYRKVDRDSLQWLDSLYEASWAEYRLGRYERALGNLLTVNAPFFDEAYFPESLILEAVIYYENCRYREAGKIIDDFLARYEPVFAELEKLAAEERDADAWYALLTELGGGEKEGLVAQVLQIALADPEVRRLGASLDEVAAEEARLVEASQKPPLAGEAAFERIVGHLRSEQGRLRSEAGRAVERKLRSEAMAVKELVAQALRVQVETARAEEGRLEASLRQRRQQPKRVQRAVVDWTDDEKLVWPFEGEYWRDELGNYELTLAQTCR
ncbi:MAG: hypothetical protein AAFU79_02920 [Myxococcota bacterium]